MITTSKIVNELVESSLLIKDALLEGIINYSAAARVLIPRIKEKYLLEVSEAAVVMALKRYAESTKAKKRFLKPEYAVTNMTVRTSLIEYVFHNSSTINTTHRKLLEKAEELDDVYINFGQGTFETTIILSSSMESHIEELTKKERRVAKMTSLSSISIGLPKESAMIPGLYYIFFRALALEGITCVEVISGFSELTCVFMEKDVDKAFTILKSVSNSSLQG